MIKHPCFDNEAHCRYGRVHLPVAGRCNIGCAYCDRKYDCANESRPGVASKLMTPEKAAGYFMKWIEKEPRIKVAGIAGPGEPLANEETFKTLEILKEKKVPVIRCLSTNGLLLEKYAVRLRKLGVSTLTVTVNAVSPQTGEKIYRWVKADGHIYHGQEGAELLLKRQMAGIRAAKAEGMLIKINVVAIPDINTEEILPLARKMKDLGADIMNINSIIPAGAMAASKAVSASVLKNIRAEASAFLNQFEHCRQCRADAAGLPGMER